MTVTTLNPHSLSQKTSIAYAFAKGYSITPDGDGCAEILTPKSEVYHIHNWSCDCLDALGRNGGNYELPDGRKVCKHVLWLSQLYPCECGASMILNMDTNWKAFVCTVCGSLKAFQQVKAERQQSYRQREQEADTIKTHQPEDVDAIIEKAEEASSLLFDTPKRKFQSRFGVAVSQYGDKWRVTVCGFSDSTHATEALAIERAERLEVLEASHADKRTKIHVA